MQISGPGEHAGFVSAQDRDGWYDTGDLGYVTETGDVVVCGRIKDVIIMAGRNIYPTDIERAAARVDGVRPGSAVAVRLKAGHPRETFAVAVDYSMLDLFRALGIAVTRASPLYDFYSIKVATAAPIVPYLLLVLMLVVRPRGLLGKRDI